MLKFSTIEDHEKAYQYLQQNPKLVKQATSEHLISHAFDLASKNREKSTAKNKELLLCIRQALIISLGLKLGSGGVVKFYER